MIDVESVYEILKKMFQNNKFTIKEVLPNVFVAKHWGLQSYKECILVHWDEEGIRISLQQDDGKAISNSLRSVLIKEYEDFFLKGLDGRLIISIPEKSLLEADLNLLIAKFDSAYTRILP